MIINNHDKLIAANYAAVLSRLMIEDGYSINRLYSGTRLSESALEDPDAKISLSDYLTLITNARQLSDDPSLGLRLGMALGVTTHGMLGLAAMSCKTFGDAIEISSRYFITRFPAMRFTCEKNGQTVTVTLSENIDLGEHKRIIVDSILSSIQTIVKFLIGEDAYKLTIDFSAQALPYPKLYQQIFGEHCHFEQPWDRMSGSTDLWHLPIQFFDPSIHKLALATCDSALQKISKRGGFALQVNDLLNKEHYTLQSIELVAQELNISPRTLSRKLKLENTTFQDILDEHRKRRAIHYLKNTDLNITQISHELNFNDSAYFSRAFRKWTGSLPSHFRNHSNTKGE